MNPIEPSDTLIRNYVKDSARFVECWEFRDEDGNHYTICQDQDGKEWIEK